MWRGLRGRHAGAYVRAGGRSRGGGGVAAATQVQQLQWCKGGGQGSTQPSPNTQAITSHNQLRAQL